MFEVNFTITEEEDEDLRYLLFVEMVINGTSGLTERYYEFFINNSTGGMANSTIELTYLGYTTESPIQALWALTGVFAIGALVVIRKRKQKK